MPKEELFDLRLFSQSTRKLLITRIYGRSRFIGDDIDLERITVRSAICGCCAQVPRCYYCHLLTDDRNQSETMQMSKV
jgi:hypothetical protein